MLPTIYTPTASEEQIWRLLQMVVLIACIFLLAGAIFGYLSRHKCSALLPKRAFVLAACHFLFAWYWHGILIFFRS